MPRLDYLNYTNNPPFRELLSVLARAHALNPYEAYAKTKRFLPGLTLRQVEAALVELELRGLLIRINNCFAIAEDWLRELMLFLDEFDKLQDAMAGYAALLEKKV